MMVTQGDIIHLNVGGTRFSTSKQTLTWIPDSFFCSMLSGRISSLKDETGAIFIDRDPELFKIILNYLRTKDLHLRDVDIYSLKHEAEYYGLAPLVKRLVLCDEMEKPSCGDVLFHGFIPPPPPPYLVRLETADNGSPLHCGMVNHTSRMSMRELGNGRGNHHTRQNSAPVMHECHIPSHSRQSSADLRFSPIHAAANFQDPRASRPASNPATYTNPLRVSIIKGHFNWLGVAYPHFVCLYRLKDSAGWNLSWTSPYLEYTIDRITVNVKVSNPGMGNHSRMVAASCGTLIHLWLISDHDGGQTREIGVFDLTVPVDFLFFIGSQLVALSHTGKIGVWHAMTQNWQHQGVNPITSYDTAGSFLLLGCNNGSIYYIDMQKFPLRMKDNDILVTELYKDPTGDKVTALSVYLTPKTSSTGNWIEIAYGTSAGTVRVIVQHPETVGQGPQLFQTFTVHRSPITRVMLSEKHLVSVCSEYNHVRTWSVTRFRGMISTQPGSNPMASFKVISLEEVDPQVHYAAGNNFGPFGEKDDQQVFVQKVVPDTDKLFVRLSSSGKRVCVIRSVDSSTMSAFCVHECEGSSRMGSRPRRYIFTGHTNGSIQMWDLSTALELHDKNVATADDGGPSPRELVRLLDQCDLSNSRSTTPSISPSPSIMVSNSYTPVTRRKVAMEQVARSLEQYSEPGGKARASNGATAKEGGDGEASAEPGSKASRV